MDPKSQRVKLNDGHFIPVLGFGTYAPPEVSKRDAVEFTPFTIEVGFCHIDCAHVYQNEEEIGQVIRSKIADGTVKREDIFCTSKLWLTSLRPELVQPALEKSPKNLQLDYVDLCIIHFPAALKPGEELSPKDENGKLIFDSVDLSHTWEVLRSVRMQADQVHQGVQLQPQAAGEDPEQAEAQVQVCLQPGGMSPLSQLEQTVGFLQVTWNCSCCLWCSEIPTSKRMGELGLARSLGGTSSLYHYQKAQENATLVVLCYQIQRGVVVLAKGNNKKWINENIQCCWPS